MFALLGGMLKCQFNKHLNELYESGKWLND